MKPVRHVKIYRRYEKPVFYFQYRRDGHREQVCSHTTEERLAQSMADTFDDGLFIHPETMTWWFIDKEGRSNVKFIDTGTENYDIAFRARSEFLSTGCMTSVRCQTLRELLGRYQNVDTNPKYRQTKACGGNYGLSWAKYNTYLATEILKTLEKTDPGMLDTPLDQLQKRRVSNAMQIFSSLFGLSSKSKRMGIALKTYLVYAYVEGETTARFDGIMNIQYNGTERDSFSPEEVRHILSVGETCLTQHELLYLYIAAGTGLRRSEIIAIDKNKLNGNIYTLDCAYKEAEGRLGLPKWNIIRVIPFPNFVIYRIKFFPTGASGMVFEDFPLHRVCLFFKKLRSALAEDQSSEFTERDWSGLTSHSLRHSLNTNLLVKEVPAYLVAEYLAWKHQDLLTMQRRYTHLVGKRLQIVADTIDALYIPDSDSPPMGEAADRFAIGG